MKKTFTQSILLLLVLMVFGGVIGAHRANAQCNAGDDAAFLSCLSTSNSIVLTGSFSVDLSDMSLVGKNIDLKNYNLNITGTPIAVNSSTTFTSNGNAGILTVYGFTFSNSNGAQYTMGALNTAMRDALNNTLQKAVNSVVGILPVTLSSFSGGLERDAEQVLLQWTTAAELNNEKFVVESSTEGEVFQRIGEIQGAGTTTEARQYQFVHHTPSAGVNYYRLKQVDFDGTFAYSKVIAIDAPGSQDIFAYPNPVQNRMTLQYDRSKGPGSFYLYNTQGQKLNFQLGGYAGNYELVLPTELPAGTYWLKVIRAGKVQTLPVIKQ